MYCLISETPSEPRNLALKKINKDYVVLTWEKPADDGGSPLTGYCVEYKDRNSILWVRGNEVLVRNTEYTCFGLLEGLEYSFRVSALNKAGQGKLSKQTDFITARTAVGELHFIFIRTGI